MKQNGLLEKTPSLLQAEVMHKRLSPRENYFRYRVFYLDLPLTPSGAEKSLPLRMTPISFRTEEHGWGNKKRGRQWVETILTTQNFSAKISTINLVSMPRLWGYVFNPVSFWFCGDERGEIKAVICEVRNTFGETHSYLCAHSDGRAIAPSDKFRAKKLFHVSPFLERAGHYNFRFLYNQKKIVIHIDYIDRDGKKKLLTSLSARRTELSRENIWSALIRNPFITFRVVALIHLQALKLLAKGVRYIKKPAQLGLKTSGSDGKGG